MIFHSFQKYYKKLLNPVNENILNQFLANVPILCPLKTPENLWFSGVFRGYKKGTLANNGWNSYYTRFSRNISHLRNIYLLYSSKKIIRYSIPMKFQYRQLTVIHFWLRKVIFNFLILNLNWLNFEHPKQMKRTCDTFTQTLFIKINWNTFT